MKVNKITIHPYKIKLKNRFVNSKREYLFKEGFIVELDVDGISGYGEIVFLEGFSNFSKQEVYWKIEELKLLFDESLSYSKNDLFDLFKVFLNQIPPMHFAFDIALLDALSRKKYISIAEYLSPNSAMNIIRFSSMHRHDKTINNKCIKIKLLCKNIDNDINDLNNIFNQYSSDTVFRLDANKGYCLEDAFKMLEFLSNKNIDYFEEPLIDMSKRNLKKIKESFNIKIAVDETVFNSQVKINELIEEKIIDVVVLKASIYGGVEKILNFKKYLDKHSVNLVFSSSLENYVGNMAVINLISALHLDCTHGVNNQLFFDFNGNVLFDEISSFLNIESIVGLGVKWNDS